MQFRKRLRFTALFLSAVMALSMTACGNEGDKTPDASGQAPVQGQQTQNPEWVYVAKDIELEQPTDSYRSKIQGDYLYSVEYGWNEETQSSSVSIYRQSLTEPGKAPECVMTINSDINSISFDADGNLYTLIYDGYEDPATGEYHSSQKLKKFLADGTEGYAVELDKAMQENQVDYVNDFLVDDKGRVYLYGQSGILLVDADGTVKGSVSLSAGDSGWIDAGAIGDDGVAYFSSSSYNGNAMSYKLSAIDFEKKEVAATYDNFPRGNLRIAAAGNQTFLVSNGTAVYEYDCKTAECRELFQWIDSDINGEQVELLTILSDGRILAFLRNWETGESFCTALTKTPGSEVPVKQTIVIATLSSSSELADPIIRFNKSSDKYKITLKSYIDYNGDWNENTWKDGITALNNAITSANCPDIIDLSNINAEKLSAKGVFEDLTPYLEKSTVLNKDDFFRNILDAHTFDGKLIGIPKSFNIETIVGNASDLGSKKGWTLDEMTQYAKQHPDQTLIEADKLSMMYILMANNMNSYVDWTNGECRFNTPEFIKILEFANGFPEEFEYDDEEPTPVQTQAGKVLLANAYISSFEEIQVYDEYFRQDAAYIGYPTEDGSGGCIFTANSAYAISSKSANKEGAWQFIEDYLTAESSDRWSYGFSTNRKQLEKEIETAITPEYYRDENGELILDENGDPIDMGTGGGIGMGNWSYTYHRATREECDRVMELIQSAKPAGIMSEEVWTILNEEVQPFFKGQKSAADVAKIIQNRVQNYVDENQ